MKIFVQVKPNSRREYVEQIGPNEYLVRANAPPIDGKANTRVVELLSEFLNVPKSKISLDGGIKSKKKIFKVDKQISHNRIT